MSGLFGFFKEKLKKDTDFDFIQDSNYSAAEAFANWKRKFWKMVSCNVLWLILNIPMLILAFFASGWILNLFTTKDALAANLAELVSMGYTEDTSLQFIGFINMFTDYLVIALLLGTGMLVIGPVHAAFTYMMRNYSREEPVFFWSDLWEQFKNNWKQSSVHMLVSLIATILFPLAIVFYSQMIDVAALKFVITTFVSAFLLIVLMMQTYVYQIMVTFDLSLANIYKNAFLLVIANLPTNFATLLAALGSLMVIPILLYFLLPQYVLLVSYLLAMIISFATAQYILNYNVNVQIQKYLMPETEE